MDPSGGGRVTELLARPLINLFWPALARIVQPLSGEYAGRRDLLASLPFFTGYGVELGLLIDTLERGGTAAIAQVHIGERVHHNQSLDALSRMAFAIAQVAARRLGPRGHGALDALLPTPTSSSPATRTVGSTPMRAACSSSNAPRSSGTEAALRADDVAAPAGSPGQALIRRQQGNRQCLGFPPSQ